MTPDFRKLQYFVALFEEGSVSRAAERLNIVQSALSMQLKQLEAELGVQLFNRSAQGVRPAPAARHFYTLCLGLLKQYDGVLQEMRDFNRQVAGVVRLGLMPSICRGPFAQILQRYLAAYPDVEVRVFESTSASLADMLLADDLDLAICNAPASKSRLIAQPVFSDPVVLVSGLDSGRRAGRPYRLSAIDDLKLVLPSRRNSLRRLLDRHIRTGSIRASKVMEIDGLNATMQFLENTDWATLLPRIAVMHDAETGRFVVNPIVEPALWSEIVELHRPDSPLSLPATLLVSGVRDVLQGLEMPSGRRRSASLDIR